MAKKQAWLERIEEVSGLSHLEIADRLGILGHHYKRMKYDAGGCSFQKLIILSKLPNMSWKILGEALEDHLLPKHLNRH